MTANHAYTPMTQLMRERFKAAAEQRGAESMLAFLIKNCPAYKTAEEVKGWMQYRLDLHRADQEGDDE